MGSAYSATLAENSLFINRKDKEALKWLSMSQEVLNKLARWRLRLLKSTSKLVHNTCIKSQELNALSTLKTGRTEKTNINEELPVIVIAESKEQCHVETK